MMAILVERNNQKNTRMLLLTADFPLVAQSTVYIKLAGFADCDVTPEARWLSVAELKGSRYTIRDLDEARAVKSVGAWVKARCPDNGKCCLVVNKRAKKQVLQQTFVFYVWEKATSNVYRSSAFKIISKLSTKEREPKRPRSEQTDPIELRLELLQSDGEEAVQLRRELSDLKSAPSPLSAESPHALLGTVLDRLRHRVAEDVDMVRKIERVLSIQPQSMMAATTTTTTQQEQPTEASPLPASEDFLAE